MQPKIKDFIMVFINLVYGIGLNRKKTGKITRDNLDSISKSPEDRFSVIDSVIM
jgi:hypothetical protein